MSDVNSDATYWGACAKHPSGWRSFDELLAEQYRRVHLDLLSRWADAARCRTILKTDLFAEGLQPSRAFLWPLLGNSSDVVGIDISASISLRAKANAVQQAPESRCEFVNCDVRDLPFAGGTFDLIISDSTLDHFSHKSHIAVALAELSRVLRPGGTLVITMDNKGNFTEPLFRLWVHLGLSDFFIGQTYAMNEFKRALAAVGLQVTDTTAIIHNPRFFTRRAITLLHKGNPSRFNGCIRRGLAMLDGLENRRTRYLTAQFIAARAVKPLE